MAKSNYFWVACTKDELELPLIVAETCVELAEKIGVTYSSIINATRRNGGSKKYIIRKVEEIEEDF